jgi:hypothetical protein
MRLWRLTKGWGGAWGWQNLRNLVWHGFVTPATARTEYASLVTLLLLSLPAAPPAGPLWSPHSHDQVRWEVARDTGGAEARGAP